MKSAKLFVLLYKYPNKPWVEYDRTKDAGWSTIQDERMRVDHPGAEYKVETR
jgi:hypothetical protein